MARRLLEAELVRRALAVDRGQAQQLISVHRVLVNGSVADNPARQIAPADAIVVIDPPARWVGRGAQKLDRALDTFEIDVSGLRALDAGASTGGFTDCLLQRGAREVVAVDVGHGQLHERLRADSRVLSLERCNIRSADVSTIEGPVDIAVGDLSFISLALVVPPLIAMCHPCSSMVLLVKPQFEAARGEVDKARGVITDPAIHERVRGDIEAMLIQNGCRVVGWVDSPITGADGNREFLVHAVTPERKAPKQVAPQSARIDPV